MSSVLRDRFREIAALMPEPLLLVAGDGLLLAANPAARRMLSSAGSPLEGSRLTDITAGPAEKVLDYLRMCARNRQMLPGSLSLRRSDGTGEARYRVHGALVSIASEAGEPAVLLRLQAAAESPSRFALLTEKIDALTREIGRRAAAEDALRAREEHLRVILTSIGDAVLVTDERGTVSFMNPVAASLTGWSEDEARGRPLSEIFVIVNEDTGVPVENPVDRVLRDGMIVGLANHTVLIGRDGGRIPIDDTAAPLRTATGELEGVVLVFRDITERKRAEREREQLLAQEQAARIAADAARVEAERASRVKDEFLAMLGHELRNPLAPILSALDLLQAPDPATREPARRVVERQVAHMARLVDDLLDVSRIAGGKVELEQQHVEIAVPVARAIEMTRSLFERSRHTLTVDVPDHGLAVDGDPTRLAQVVANLLGNAAKFTEPGGRVEVTARAEGGDVVIRVLDTGIGIQAGMLPRVFDAFAQEHQTIARSRGGLGLGLAIVRNLVLIHGGTVDAYSDGEGRGSMFTIRLPAAEGPSSEALPAAPREDGAAPGLCILVVDDNEDAAAMLALLLRKLGHSTRAAHSGPEALLAVEAAPPDVAFLDIGLPEMDGYELARRLREKPGLEGIYLVALTGYGQEADRQRAMEAGFDFHLVKPATRAGLQAVLAGLAAKRDDSMESYLAAPKER